MGKILDRAEAERTVEVLREIHAAGFRTKPNRRKQTLIGQAARQFERDQRYVSHRIKTIQRNYPDLAEEIAVLIADETQTFDIEQMPSTDEPIENLLDAIERRHQRKVDAQQAAIPVNIHTPGPIAVAIIGDIHIDDPGCAMGPLRRDTELIANTEGMYAIAVGDYRNNWIGRLTKLWANQETTQKQALRLIEWWFGACGNKLIAAVQGNHDCHDMETEALTARGWVPGAEVREDDLILSLDDQGRPVWTRIIERIQRDNTEEMVSIETNVLNLRVTPNHRVLHRERKSGHEWSERQYTRADSLPARFSLPVSAPSLRPEHSLPDAWIALTGWFLTDGGVSRGRVTFYQSKDAPALEAALAGCGFSPKVIVRDRSITEVCGRALKSVPLPQREYHLSAEESATFLAVAQGKGVVPTWVEHLSDRQFDVFLNAVIAGDGSWSTNGGPSAVVHGTKAFLDSLQAVCVSHGWCAHLSVAREKDWRLNVCRRAEYQADRKRIVRRVLAASRVWCLRVPHGNFMVRRNGKAHFSGNSWHTEGGDAVEIMHRLSGQASLYGEPAYRLDLRLPSGANALVHVRHDFAGSSQFNAAHGQVRETLFGYRDHIIACGDRHHSGYIPIWHNDPARLCHGMRVGCYKDFDPFAAEKGFRWANWSRTMVAIIDPAKADDPVEFITVRFSVEAAVEELNRRREAWQRDNLQAQDRRQGAARKRRAGNDRHKGKR